MAVVSQHHAIPDPLPHHASFAPNATITGIGPAANHFETTSEIARQAGGSGVLGVLGAIALVVLLIVLSYWAATLMAGWREEPRARRPGPRPGWRPDTGLYRYEGPRLALREAFLDARASLEATAGTSLRPYTLREIVDRLRIAGVEDVVDRFSRAMYSRVMPRLEEAKRLARRVREVAESWRGGGS